MGAESKITDLCMIINLDEVFMGESSTINRGNWITGFPSGSDSKHFAHQPERVSKLVIGAHSAITKNHHIDCTNRIEIGAFTTIAGYRSQFLTHSIDLDNCRQHSAPITIGDYCFVGSDVLVLGGSRIPSRCVLGAKSLLKSAFTEEGFLYAGVPAIKKSKISNDAKYFTRIKGFVN